jgi:hypothetical protein
MHCAPYQADVASFNQAAVYEARMALYNGAVQDDISGVTQNDTTRSKWSSPGVSWAPIHLHH